MFPLEIQAASLVPSLDIAMPDQACQLAVDLQVSPESVDIQMFPLATVAASLVPSLDDVMRYHSCCCWLNLDVHVSPESVDVEMLYL